jgi:protein-disulfide isomerase
MGCRLKSADNKRGNAGMGRQVGRRALAPVWAFALAMLALAAPARAEFDLAAAMADRVLGNPKAPVTVIEYASLTCPHCAHFHADILPGIKQRFIDTGKVKIIFRDFPLDKVALDAAMLAHCVAPERYFAFVQTLFATQSKWIAADDTSEALAAAAGDLGMKPADAKACMANEQLRDAIVKSRFDGDKAWNIQATPTFILNDGAFVVIGANEERFLDGLKFVGVAVPETPAPAKK